MGFSGELEGSLVLQWLRTPTGLAKRLGKSNRRVLPIPLSRFHSGVDDPPPALITIQPLSVAWAGVNGEDIARPFLPFGLSKNPPPRHRAASTRTRLL
jgi:hypothetical protein